MLLKRIFERRKILSLFLICILSRVITNISYYEDIDSLRFGLSAIDFNVLESRPHFPGYAIYCFILQNIFNLTNDIGIATSSIGGISIFLIILYSIKLFKLFKLSDFEYMVLILFLNPFIWIMSNRYMPDLFGLSLLIICFYYLIRIIKFNEIKDFLIFGIIIGIQCGVRLSYVPFFLPALFLIFNVKVMYSILGFLISTGAWLIPLVYITGYENFLEIFKNDTHGHFYKWGGTILSSESSLKIRLYNLIEYVFVDGFSFWAKNRNWTTIINSIFILVFFVSFFKKVFFKRKLKNIKLETVITFLCFLSYFIWVLLFQNINYKPRHIMPFIPLIAFMLNEGIRTLLDVKKNILIILILFLLPNIYITSNLVIQHKKESALSQIKTFLDEEEHKKVVVFSDGLKIFYLDNTLRNKNIKLLNLNKRNYEQLKKFIDLDYKIYSSMKLNELSNFELEEYFFFHNPHVNRLWSQLKLYKYE